ncbi:hypothetical protein AgCh_033213 [Apium graveolens]
MIVEERRQNHKKIGGVVTTVDRGELIDKDVFTGTNKTTKLANITAGGIQCSNKRRENVDSVAENNGLDLGFEGMMVIDPRGRSSGLAFLWRDRDQANLLSLSQNHIWRFQLKNLTTGQIRTDWNQDLLEVRTSYQNLRSYQNLSAGRLTVKEGSCFTVED